MVRKAPRQPSPSGSVLLIALAALLCGAFFVTLGAPIVVGATGPHASQPAQQATPTAIPSLLLPASFGGVPLPPPQGTSHAGLFTSYEGSKTCLGCHAAETSEMHASLHYQWQGDTPAVPAIGQAGKLGAINDFCGYPDINWLGILTNVDGVRVDGGCATCHAGMGLKPAATATQAQLENIDCLMCHSETYRRKVVPVAGGGYRMVVAPEKMSVSFLQGITDIGRPTKAACLSCHLSSGGAPNNKRGDLEPLHADPPATLDVHMASEANGGAGLDCVSCHTTASHRIAGRGVDMRATDLNEPVKCTNCHATQPHNSAALNQHTQRVDCAVCHIPAFARVRSTDMVRDFSQSEVDPAKKLYEPVITRQSNVPPEYRFWNGQSSFYEFGQPAVAGPSGRVLMAGPLGDITDTAAKIYPFKHHLALQAADVATDRLIPNKTSVLFQTGNVDAAVRQGAAAVGWDLPQGYSFVPTERWMTINHEVAPKESALDCASCHYGATRMNFAQLGYTPKATRNGDPLCSSCHSAKNEEWSDRFTGVHQQHVDEENIACSQCHNR